MYKPEPHKNKSRPKAALRETPKSISGCFAVDRHGHVHHHIGVQSHTDSAFAHDLDRAVGQADLRLGNLVALLAQLFGDVVVGHGTKQTTVHASLLLELLPAWQLRPFRVQRAWLRTLPWRLPWRDGRGQRESGSCGRSRL